MLQGVYPSPERIDLLANDWKNGLSFQKLRPGLPDLKHGILPAEEGEIEAQAEDRRKKKPFHLERYAAEELGAPVVGRLEYPTRPISSTAWFTRTDRVRDNEPDHQVPLQYAEVGCIWQYGQCGWRFLS